MLAYPDGRIRVYGTLPRLRHGDMLSVKVRVGKDGRLKLISLQTHKGRGTKVLLSTLGLILAALYLVRVLRWDTRQGGLCQI